MPFNLDEYKKWAKKFKEAGGQPCITTYFKIKNEEELSFRQILRHLIYKDVNSEPKHTKNEYQPLDPMVIPE